MAGLNLHQDRNGAISRQSTVGRDACISGVGLHSGRVVNVRLKHAPPDTGIIFRRVDLAPMVEIRAVYDRVVDTRLCTALAACGDPAVRVATVEHLMAALAACGIDNAIVEVDAEEMPILDGSSAPWLDLLDSAGQLDQDRPGRIVEVLRPVTVRRGDAIVSLYPSLPYAGAGLALDVTIDFEARAIGRQRLQIERIDRVSFFDELSDCRTFTFADEIDSLRAVGLARGGSLDNAVVVSGDEVLNPTGLRRKDEFVRHKALDVVGDLALAGARIRGRFVGLRPGHGLNNALLHALFSARSNWSMVGRAPQAPARAA